MAAVSNMTLEELELWIEQLIERKLQAYFVAPDARSVDEILDSIDQNRWTPPAGAKSSLELLREDRDR